MSALRRTRAEFKFTLPFETHQEGRWIIAYCPALELASQGQTFEKAKSNLVEAIRGFLESCYDRGVLDEVLKESGFELAQQSGARVADPQHTIDVPFHLLGKRNAEAAAC